MRYGIDWQERIAPDEEARFEVLGATLVAIQEERDDRYSEQGRALHRKSHGGAEGAFVVREDLADVLPVELHVGPFQPGARYDALVRFSNGAFKRSRDKVPDIRGVAIKLCDVPGPKALTGTEDPRTQDFLLILNPTTPMSSPEHFVKVVELAAMGSEATLLPRLMWAVGPLTAIRILRGLLADLNAPFSGFPAGRFHSGTPFRFGPSAARFALAPVGEHRPLRGDDSSFGEQLRATLRDGVSWDFQVQLYQDATSTPIEDNRVRWTEQVSPFVTVARLELPPVDVDSDAFAALQARIETLSFDPWHAVEDLRPLGAMNRARKAAYFASVQHRGAQTD